MLPAGSLAPSGITNRIEQTFQGRGQTIDQAG
jgi:hypothetical protein